jgi:hypothetical protein
VGSFVHYGVTVEAGAVVGPAAFVMKGEQVPAGAFWAGNPAEPADRPLLDLPVPERAAEPPRARRRELVLAAYGPTLAAAGTPLALQEGRPEWQALGLGAWLVGLGCIGVSLRRARVRRAEVPPSAPARPGEQVGRSAIAASMELTEVAESGRAVEEVPAAAAPAGGAPALGQPTGPASKVPELRPMIPAPASPAARSDTGRATDSSGLPPDETSATWARLSAELDRLEELRSRWAS